jgi:translation initiation factor IF-1
MAKEEGVVLEGVVVDLLPNAMFKVQLDGQETVVIGIISGRMRQNKIKILMIKKVGRNVLTLAANLFLLNA